MHLQAKSSETLEHPSSVNFVPPQADSEGIRQVASRSRITHPVQITQPRQRSVRPPPSSYWGSTANFTVTTVPLHMHGPPPPEDAPAKTKLDYLHAQLNSIGTTSVVLDRFSLLGRNERRQGGVQSEFWPCVRFVFWFWRCRPNV